MSLLNTATKKLTSLKSSLPAIPRQTALAVILPLFVAMLGLQILSFTTVRDVIDQKIFHPIIFNIRHYVRPQKLDPRIKIFAYDNRTASYLKSLDIPLTAWGQLFAAFGTKDNTRLVVDKLFDSPSTQEDIEQFAGYLRGSKAKTAIISFTYPGDISYRKPISDELITENENRTVHLKEDTNKLETIKSQNIPYGAPTQLLSLFSVFGHAEYKGDNRIQPFITLDGAKILPHAGLTLADRVEIRGKSLLVNGHDAHLGRDGKILLNLAPKSTYVKNTMTLLAAIERAKRSQDISIVEPGDYVVILPSMFTGSTDFQNTPFGSMPGGYAIVALIQSALTGDWLAEVHDPGFIIIGLGILGFWIGYHFRPGMAVLGLSVFVTTIITLSIVWFVFFGVSYSFVLPVIGIMMSGLAGVIVHSGMASLEETRIARELEVATLVQKSFFPTKKQNLDGRTEVDGRSLPASECGGDWWGCFQRSGFTYIMLGDAVGHGVPAALVTAVAFSATRMLDMNASTDSSSPLAPSVILSNLNNVLCDMNSEMACMTFFILRVHDDTGDCVFANAGNPQPALIPSDSADDRLAKGQRFKTLLARGDVLGLSADATFAEHQITLKPGDRIVMYTDGLVENTAESSREPIGKIWLKQKLNHLANESAPSLREQLWDAYLKSIGSVPPADDVTLVVISRT